MVDDIAASRQAVAPNPTPSPTPICAACNQNEETWKAMTNVAPPQLLGTSAALIEASCGQMIFGLNSHERRPPASLVKIMTAMVAADQDKMNQEVDIAIDGWALSAEDESTIMGLEKGMRMTVEELVWGLLLRSGNDAAVEIARVFGGNDAFVAKMNAKAKQLGLEDTQFRNPHGLDAEGAFSSTFDMAVMGNALLKYPRLAEMVVTKDHPTTWSNQTMPNGNWLLYYQDPRFEYTPLGIKTGYTETAGATIVGAGVRDGRTLVVSVFNSADIFWDSARLLDWALDNTRKAC